MIHNHELPKKKGRRVIRRLMPLLRYPVKSETVKNCASAAVASLRFHKKNVKKKFGLRWRTGVIQRWTMHPFPFLLILRPKLWGPWLPGIPRGPYWTDVSRAKLHSLRESHPRIFPHLKKPRAPRMTSLNRIIAGKFECSGSPTIGRRIQGNWGGRFFWWFSEWTAISEDQFKNFKEMANF